MKLIEQKLKVIDIDYHDDILYTPGLFFDVIEHYFEDQFLVIKWYKNYEDGSTREVMTYIPTINIEFVYVYLDDTDFKEKRRYKNG
jgi:hypothetical protein